MKFEGTHPPPPLFFVRISFHGSCFAICCNDIILNLLLEAASRYGSRCHARPMFFLRAIFAAGTLLNGSKNPDTDWAPSERPPEAAGDFCARKRKSERSLAYSTLRVNCYVT